VRPGYLLDQNYKHNLKIRRTLDAIVQAIRATGTTPAGPSSWPTSRRSGLLTASIITFDRQAGPGFGADYFEALVKGSEGASFPLAQGQSVDDLIAFLKPSCSIPRWPPRKVSGFDEDWSPIPPSTSMKDHPGRGRGLLQGLVDEKDETPISYGLELPAR